jgi:hypothetical protein
LAHKQMMAPLQGGLQQEAQSRRFTWLQAIHTLHTKREESSYLRHASPKTYTTTSRYASLLSSAGFMHCATLLKIDINSPCGPP